MIILIGGAPKTGKSYLAHNIAKQKNGKVIELDTLMLEWNLSVSDKDFSKKLPVWQAKRDGKKSTIEDYRVEAQTYWPAIKLLIDSELNKTSVSIIEGAQLSPKLLRQWLDSLNDKQSRSVEVIFLSHSSAPLNSEFKADAEVNGFKTVQRDM
ncbi:MAG: hypothetical protein U0516_02485 [Candidatus Saccharibacteria bacterium]